MVKKVVITRANHQAQAFAASVVNRLCGINMNDFVFEPMTEIVHFPINTAKLGEYDGIIMTSMNAAVSLGLNAPARDLLADKPFFCVGEHTRQKIMATGAQNIVMFAQTAKQLADEMLEKSDGLICADKNLLYMRGRDVAFDMKQALSESARGKDLGVTVDQIVCYEARAVDRFSPNIAEALLPGDVGMITFFSKRTANVFARMWASEFENDEEYKDKLDGVKALCISEDVAECVQGVFDEKLCLVAKTPNMAGMIDQIEAYIQS